MANSRFANPVWHLIDAKDQIVGRLATQVVHILRGKHKPTYTPHYDCGDVVVIINAEKIHFTGNKVKDKKYQWHTGWVGGLKEITVENQLKKKPEEVIYIHL
jgi:large subunit ribosomal protein L13